MAAEQWVILLVVVLVLLALGVMWSRRRRSGQLRERFGPEYDRLVADRDGDRRTVEAELAERTKRRARFDLKELSATERDQYAEQWRRTQLKFLDEPEAAIIEADRLVVTVMRARGYPIEDFEQRAADLSVDHPVVVQNYRAGHEISERHATGQASTEDLRQGMIHHRALLEDLLGLEPSETDLTRDATPGTTAGRAQPAAAAGTAVADRDRDATDRDATDRDAGERERDVAEAEAAERTAERTAEADRDAEARAAQERADEARVVEERVAQERAAADDRAAAEREAAERRAAEEEAAADRARRPEDEADATAPRAADGDGTTRRTEVR